VAAVEEINIALLRAGRVCKTRSHLWVDLKRASKPTAILMMWHAG
jgi:hypothetical protein